MTRASCVICGDARATVVVADVNARERALCTDCWRRLEREMPGLTLLHFSGDPS